MKLFNYLLSAAAIALIAPQAHADGDMTMKLNEGGKSTEYTVSSIKSISFEGNTMKIETADGVKTANVLSLDNITFSMKTSATDDIVKDFKDGVTVVSKNGVIEIMAGEDTPVCIDVFNSGGTHMMQAKGKGTASVDLNSLPAGIYIVKANDKTIKFIR